MSDRHAMPYLSNDECLALGLEPYAVYGGRVHSFRDDAGVVHPHGSLRYGVALDDAAHALMTRVAALAGARGA